MSGFLSGIKWNISFIRIINTMTLSQINHKLFTSLIETQGFSMVYCFCTDQFFIDYEWRDTYGKKYSCFSKRACTV